MPWLELWMKRMAMVLLLPSTLQKKVKGGLTRGLSLASTAPPVWTERSSLPVGVYGRHHPITFANETHGFFMTGSNSFQLVTDDFYIYDEASDAWIGVSGDVPGGGRSFGYGIVLPVENHTKAYYGFGVNGAGDRLNDLWELDMVTLQAKQLTPCPCLGRRHPAMVPVLNIVDDGSGTETSSWEIHVGLGDGTIGNLNDWWSYDIDRDEWTQLDDFPGSKRHHPFYFSLQNKAYAGLGHSSGYSPYIERDWYMYDSSTKSWTRQEDFKSYDNTQLVSTEARVAGTQFSIDNKGFVLSGDGDDHSYMEQGEFHMYDPAQDQWTVLPPHPGVSRWAPGSFVMRGSARVYMTSGYDRKANTLYDDLWMIDVGSILFDDDEIAVTSTQNTFIDNSGSTGPEAANTSIDVSVDEQEEIKQTTTAQALGYDGSGANLGQYIPVPTNFFVTMFSFTPLIIMIF